MFVTPYFRCDNHALRDYSKSSLNVINRFNFKHNDIPILP